MTTGTTDRSGLEVLDLEESMELLAGVPIGRVAMIDGGEIAVTFEADGASQPPDRAGMRPAGVRGVGCGCGPPWHVLG